MDALVFALMVLSAITVAGLAGWLAWAVTRH